MTSPAIIPAIFLAIFLALGPSGDDARLESLLGEHFKAKTKSQRKSLRKKIMKTDGLTPGKLAAAIRRVQLWEEQPAGRYEVSVRLRKGKSSELAVWVSVPEGYDPAKRWPLLITMHGQGGQARPMLELTRRFLGSWAEEFIIAAPQDIGPLGFTLPVQVVSRPRNLVGALRRHFHIDSDRVYLMGYSQGGHNAWMAAVMHADCFAGIVPLATPLQLVGGDMLYDQVLPNARNTGVLFCWGVNDTLDGSGKVRADGGNAARNRKITAVIGALAFKHFEAVELTEVGHIGVVPPPKLLSELLGRRRVHYPRRVRQMFRLPDQSVAYWVSADRLLGEPLAHGKLQIPVPPGEDPRLTQRNWLIERLGKIEARTKGQTIRLTTRRSGHIILLLSDELLDLDRPVTIIRNQKKRWEGRIRRDMRVVLTESVREWDFDRLPVARAVIPVGGKVKFGYPDLGSKKGKRKKSRGVQPARPRE